MLKNEPRNREERRHPEGVVERRFLSVEECIEITGLGRTLVWQLIRSGEIKALRVGRRVVVPVTALDAWERSLPTVKAG
jgi:excisionase family DNA binding protein